MTLVVIALIVADVLWAIATLAYVEFRLVHMLRWMRSQEGINAELGVAVFGIDPERMAATRQRIMERIAEE